MPKKTNKTRNIFGEISADDAFAILKGICRFENKSISEYKDWAVDAPAEFFGHVLKQWKKGQKGVTNEELMEIRKAGRNWKKRINCEKSCTNNRNLILFGGRKDASVDNSNNRKNLYGRSSKCNPL